jgi:hypothetical protein
MSDLAALRGCYEREVERNPHLYGQIDVKWEIAAGGGVTSARISKSTVGSPKVEGCIVQEVLKWTFPRSDAPSYVEWPFRFGLTPTSDAGRT